MSVIFPVGYVGLGTVGAATWWYLFDENGPQVSFYQLVSLKIYCSKNVHLHVLCYKHSPVWSQQSPEIEKHYLNWEKARVQQLFPHHIWAMLGHRGRADVPHIRSVWRVFLCRDILCSVPSRTQCSRTWTARCLSPVTRPPWLCLCWLPLRCSMLSTGMYSKNVWYATEWN